MAENTQRLKMLRLYEILVKESDEKHPLTTAALLSRLGALGIVCDRRTLSRDIALINAEVAEVMCVAAGHEKAYYIEDRPFTLPELGILIDAARAAAFIPEGKTEELIGKLTQLASASSRERLQRAAAGFSAPKHTNENIYYNISALQEAIAADRAASFRYFDLGEDGKRAYRYEGERCTAEPLTLALRNDRYYLIAYTEKHGGLTCYRVDRMEGAAVEDKPVTEAARESEKELGMFIERNFSMFGGAQEEVELIFDREVLGAIYDKFGEDTPVRRRRGNRLSARVPVVVSPTFYGWLAQFAGKITITSPMCVCDAYKAHLQSALRAAEQWKG